MTAYIGNKPIRNVLYFNRNKNTKINSDQIADKTYSDPNHRTELYNDTFVILTYPGFKVAGTWYSNHTYIPSFILSDNNIIFKNDNSYGSTVYHPSNPITRSCDYKIQQISGSSWGTTFYKQWTYTFDGYNFNYKKESWQVNKNGVSTDVTVEDEQSIHTNNLAALIIKGPTASNDTYEVITYSIEKNSRVIIPFQFDTYKNISKLYAGEELVHENT